MGWCKNISPATCSTRLPRNSWRFAEHSYDIIGGVEINWNGPGWSIGLGAPNSALTGNNTPNSETVYNGSTPVTFTEQRSTQTKWIDLFGWGTSGKESRPVTIGEPQMQPWCYYGGYIGGVTYQSQYGPVSGNLTGIWDWGANSIRNPKTGKDETNWRTPNQSRMGMPD